MSGALTPTRQYVDVEFEPGGKRYRYYSDTHRFAPEDEAAVPYHRGGGWERVTVKAIDLPIPNIEIKPIFSIEEASAADFDQRDASERKPAGLADYVRPRASAGHEPGTDPLAAQPVREFTRTREGSQLPPWED